MHASSRSAPVSARHTAAPRILEALSDHAQQQHNSIMRYYVQIPIHVCVLMQYGTPLLVLTKRASVLRNTWGTSSLKVSEPSLSRIGMAAGWMCDTGCGVRRSLLRTVPQ